MTRAHIGHTYLTNGYLLRSEYQPECVSCMSPLTVEHILVDCTEFNDVRTKYYDNVTLTEVFKDVNPLLVIGFLKEIGLYIYF